MARHWDDDGTRMVDAIRRVIERETGVAPKTRAFPWWLLRLAAPFVATARELLEMRYLWKQPVRMNNDRLKAVRETNRTPRGATR